MSNGKGAEEEEENRLWGREEGKKEREIIYVWLAKVTEKGRDNKRQKATSHTNDGTERRGRKILPHLPPMLASSSTLGEDGLLPVTLRSENEE